MYSLDLVLRVQDEINLLHHTGAEITVRTLRDHIGAGLGRRELTNLGHRIHRAIRMLRARNRVAVHERTMPGRKIIYYIIIPLPASPAQINTDPHA